MADKKKDWLSQCKKCRGKCCKHIALEIDKPTNKTDYDNIRWYLMHRDVTVFIDHDKKWNLQFPTRCEHLTSENRCGIYPERPKVCSDYPGENNCEYEGEDEPYTVLFRNDAEFTAYLEKQGKSWRWKRR